MVDGCPYCFRYASARAWGPKLPGLLSVLGSYIVMREVSAKRSIASEAGREGGRSQLRDPEATIPRLLLSMSIADIFFSAPYIFTTWAAPKEIENLYQAAGTVGTCTAQGASVQFGVSTSPLFHLSLSFCSLLIVRWNWPVRRLVRLEIVLQALIWLYGLVATIPFIPLGYYNPTSTVCWIASYPHHCGVREDDNIECLRGGGRQASFFRAFFAFWPTWPCIILGVLSMAAIYQKVRQLETRNRRYAGSIVVVNPVEMLAIANAVEDEGNGSSSNHTDLFGLALQSRTPSKRWRTSSRALRSNCDRQRSRAVATQAICYTFAFLVTFSLDTIVLLWNVVNLKASQGMIVAAYILFPLQGFFNVLIYSRTATLVTWEGKLLKRGIDGLCNPFRRCWKCLRRKVRQRPHEESDDKANRSSRSFSRASRARETPQSVEDLDHGESSTSVADELIDPDPRASSDSSIASLPSTGNGNPKNDDLSASSHKSSDDCEVQSNLSQQSENIQDQPINSSDISLSSDNGNSKNQSHRR